MSFKNLFASQKLLTILHNTLENETTKNKVSNVSLKGETNAYNQYSLLIVMYFIIKYKIIIEDDTFLEESLLELETITNTYQDHQDLIFSLTKLLTKLTAKKLNLENSESLAAKKEILTYIYDKYIVNGYCFHSFPSCFKSHVEIEGLTKEVDLKELNTLKKINYIFANHHYDNFLAKNLNIKTKAIYITDSPAMAYYYAFRSPEYLANLTSLSKYYENITNTEINKEAFYLKDYEACKNNLLKMCEHLKMTSKEQNTIIKTFNKEWQTLDLENSRPCLAFIKRSNLAKDSIPNITKLLNELDKTDLVYQVAKITDSKYPLIRRYTDINSLDLKVITMPSYREIKTNSLNKETPKVKLTLNNVYQISKEEVSLQPKQQENKPSFLYNYGNISIIALLGMLLISLGLTLSIILKVLGG